MKTLEMYHYINTLSQVTDRDNDYMLDSIARELKANYTPERRARFLCVKFAVRETIDTLRLDAFIYDYRHGISAHDYTYGVTVSQQLDTHNVTTLDALKKSLVFNQALNDARDALMFVRDAERRDDIPVMIELYKDGLYVHEIEFNTITDAVEW